MYFNAAPWKNSDSSGAQPSTSETLPDTENDEDVPPKVKAPVKPSDDAIIGTRTLSDDEDEDQAIEEMERELTKEVKASVATRSSAQRAARPHFEPLMVKLRNVKGGPRVVETKNVTNWPETIHKPKTGGVQARQPRGVLDSRKVHQRHIPTTQFDAIAEATERRKEALLGAGSTDPTASGTTIHGRKGKTVRELQTEMMKGESVKEKVARMKAEASGQKIPELSPPGVSSKPVEPVLGTGLSAFAELPEDARLSDSESDPELDLEADPPATPARRVRSISRTKSRHRLSESDSSDEEYDPTRPGHSRKRRSKSTTSTSSSVRRSDRIANTPKKQPQPSVKLRRSSRISSRPQSQAPSRKTSPVRTNPLPTQQQDLIKQATERTQRIQKRSEIRGDTADNMQKIQKKTPVEPRSRSASQSPGEEDEKELRRNAGRQSRKDRAADEMQLRKVREDRKRAAPAPLDAGPPARVKNIMGMQAPKKKEKADEAPEVVKKAPEVQPDDPEESEGPSTSTALPQRVSHQPKQPAVVSEISPDFSVLRDREHSTSTPDLLKCPPQTLEDLNLSEDSIDDKKDDGDNLDTSHEDLVHEPRPALKVVVSETSEASSEDMPLQVDEVMDEDPALIFEIPASEEVAPQAVEKPVKPLDTVEPAAENVTTTASASEVAPKDAPETAKEASKHFEKADAPEVTSEADRELPKPSEDVVVPEVAAKQSEAVDDIAKPSGDVVAPEVAAKDPGVVAPDVFEKPLMPSVVMPALKSARESSEVVEKKPSEPIVNTPKKKTPPVSTIPCRPPTLKPTLSELCAPPPTSAKTSTAPKSPKQIIACQFGLDISDSEEEEEEKMEAVQKIPEKMPEVQPPVEVDTEDEDSLRIVEDDEGPSTSKTPIKDVPESAAKVSEAPKSVTTVKKVVEKPPSEASNPPKIIPPPERKPIVVIAPPKRDPILKPRKLTTIAPSRVIPTPSPMSSSQNDDDLSLDILAGAKVTRPPVKKPAVKRPAREEDAPSTSAAPSEPAPKKKPVPSLQKAKSVRDVKKKVQPVVVRATSVKEREAETPEEPAAENTPTTSTKKKEAILIEPRARGRPKKDASRPVGVKEAAQKASEAGTKKSAKTLSTARGHLRQALDLKVGLNELKRPLEEKGIVLGDSIPLSAADAAEVMIEFLRETSAGDMWAVMKKQRTDGNLLPLVNKEEENFLQVSVTLISEDQLLLEQLIE